MILPDEAATMRAGAELAHAVGAGDVIALSGPLGVGKTALARVPSPSFAIVQPYDDVEPAVWHVDLYRIDAPTELDELGLDSAGDAVLVVEWPEGAGPDMWPEALTLSLDFGPDGERILTAKVPPSWEGRWPPR